MSPRPRCSGSSTSPAGSATPPAPGTRLTLRRSGGPPIAAIAADPAGRFLFEAVELDETEPTRLSLELADAGGARVLAHDFEVRYAPASSETSSVTTVLPKPLQIETIDGLVPLAEEGAVLPARRKQTFRRLNDNRSIPLKLYQGHDAVGEIRIENIPPEGGKDSFIDVEVEVTEANELRGAAQVRTQSGRVVAKVDVSIRFEVPEVPVEDALHHQFVDLQQRWSRARANAADLEGATDRLIAEIEELFEQVPIERQEIQVALRRLAHLVQPPRDEMEPSRAEFERLLARCRALAEELETSSQATIARRPPADATVIKAAQKDFARVRQLVLVMERLEQEGIAAHTRRDRKAWARITDALDDVQAGLRQRPSTEAPPTPILKRMAANDVLRQLSSLQLRARTLVTEQRVDDWEKEIARIQNGLQQVFSHLMAIEDGLAADQGRAQVQRIYARELLPLEESIQRLGIDIARAH
jgi:hypothetical protein